MMDDNSGASCGGHCIAFGLYHWASVWKSSEHTGLMRGVITYLYHPPCWEVETKGLLPFSKNQIQPQPYLLTLYCPGVQILSPLPNRNFLGDTVNVQFILSFTQLQLGAWDR